MGRREVFLDSSVLITALLSSKGASYALLHHGRKKFRFITSEYVLAEIQDVLKRKFGHRPILRNDLFLLLGLANISVLPAPTPNALEPFMGSIEAADAPILASAAACDYLATLDRDFFTEEVLRLARDRSLVICTPGELLAQIRG